jgi:hypothetical protein
MKIIRSNSSALEKVYDRRFYRPKRVDRIIFISSPAPPIP